MTWCDYRIPFKVEEQTKFKQQIRQKKDPPPDYLVVMKMKKKEEDEEDPPNYFEAIRSLNAWQIFTINLSNFGS